MSIESLIEHGLQEHRSGRLDQAKRIYEQILAENPRHPDALHLLGLTALQSGERETAVELIGKAIAAQPRNWAFQANLARRYSSSNDTRKRSLRSGTRSNSTPTSLSCKWVWPTASRCRARCPRRRRNYAN